MRVSLNWLDVVGILISGLPDLSLLDPLGASFMSRHTRRAFLSSSAAATGALALGAYVNTTVAQQSKSPNERLRIAGVGTTNRAGADLAELASQDIVAL